MKKSELLRKVGTHEQLFGIREYILCSGKASGLKAIEVKNACGIRFTILVDRCLDIYDLSYRGNNISFLSKTNVVNSTYFHEEKAKGFLQNFFVGFLTTCGLTYMGAFCEDENEELGLHGQISNTPAYEVGARVIDKDENTYIEIFGKVKQAQVFGECIVLTRRIKLFAYKNIISIEDEVENLTTEKTPFMILYHMNYGYPFLSKDLQIKTHSKNVVGRDDNAKSNIKKYNKIEEPSDGRPEECFFHEMENENGIVTYELENKCLATKIVVTYNSKNLPYFTEWKCMKSNEYVLGMEPGNCHVLGREVARKDKTLKYLKPFEKQQFHINIEIK